MYESKMFENRNTDKYITDKSIALQLIHVWQHDTCSIPSLIELCNCIPWFPYDGYYFIYFLAVIVFVCMAVLYSLTCRRIYFCQELQRNANHDRQVLFYIVIQLLSSEVCSRDKAVCIYIIYFSAGSCLNSRFLILFSIGVALLPR